MGTRVQKQPQLRKDTVTGNPVVTKPKVPVTDNKNIKKPNQLSPKDQRKFNHLTDRGRPKTGNPILTGKPIRPAPTGGEALSKKAFDKIINNVGKWYNPNPLEIIGGPEGPVSNENARENLRWAMDQVKNNTVTIIDDRIKCLDPNDPCYGDASIDLTQFDRNSNTIILRDPPKDSPKVEREPDFNDYPW